MNRSYVNAWLISAYYFFLFGAIGCLIPYLPLYYQHIGLSGQQIGLLLGLGSLILLVAGPLWGALGDRFNLHRWLLPLATFGALVPIYFFPFTHTFILLSGLTLLQAFFATAIGPLIDSAALEVAQTAQLSFGRLRLGGSLGFTVISLATGWLLTYIPLVGIFYGYMLCLGLATLIALPLPARRQHWKEPLGRGFRALFSQPSLLSFLLVAFLVGISTNAVQFFFPLYIQSIGGDANMIGIAGAVAAFSEMPVMFAAHRIIKRLGGLWSTLVISITLYALRWLALSFATTPAIVLLVQAFHGVSFGLFLVSSTAYVEAQAPAGLSATAQALFILVLWGIGSFVGSFVGGIIFQNFGAPVLFQGASLITFLALILLVASRYLTTRVARTEL